MDIYLFTIFVFSLQNFNLVSSIPIGSLNTTKSNDTEKVRILSRTKRQFFLPMTAKVFKFWRPHGYFNLCPFVRPLPLDPVWNIGCKPLSQYPIMPLISSTTFMPDTTTTEPTSTPSPVYHYRNQQAAPHKNPYYSYNEDNDDDDEVDHENPNDSDETEDPYEKQPDSDTYNTNDIDYSDYERK